MSRGGVIDERAGRKPLGLAIAGLIGLRALAASLAWALGLARRPLSPAAWALLAGRLPARRKAGAR